MTYPLDTIRRRLMMQSGRKDFDKQYKGSIDCHRKIMLKEGFRGFYGGFLANLIKSQSSVAALIVYDKIKVKKLD